MSIAKNLSNFGDHVTLLSMLGESKSFLKEINKNLSKKKKKILYLKKILQLLLRKDMLTMFQAVNYLEFIISMMK